MNEEQQMPIQSLARNSLDMMRVESSFDDDADKIREVLSYILSTTKLMEKEELAERRQGYALTIEAFVSLVESKMASLMKKETHLRTRRNEARQQYLALLESNHPFETLSDDDRESNYLAKARVGSLFREDDSKMDEDFLSRTSEEGSK